MLDWPDIAKVMGAVSGPVAGIALAVMRARASEKRKDAKIRADRRDAETLARKAEWTALLGEREMQAEKTRAELRLELREQISHVASKDDIAQVDKRLSSLEQAVNQQAQSYALVANDMRHLEHNVRELAAFREAQIAVIQGIKEESKEQLQDAKEALLDRLSRLEYRMDLANIPSDPRGK